MSTYPSGQHLHPAYTQLISRDLRLSWQQHPVPPKFSSSPSQLLLKSKVVEANSITISYTTPFLPSLDAERIIQDASLNI